ncbi:MAG: hypothetical protein ACXVDI_25455, partial [Ktedonobacterales bacterium]
SVGRISDQMGLSPAVITAHVELERVREAHAEEPENPRLEVKRLMAEAQAYLAVVAERDRQLDEMRSYTLQGLLTPETLMQREQEFGELAAMRYRNPELLCGIDLLRQAQKEAAG